MRRLSPLHLLLFILLFIAGAPSVVSARQLPFSHFSTTSLSDDQSRTTTWHYDAAGRARALILPNGQKQENTYDLAGRLTQRSLRGAVSGGNGYRLLIAEFHWTHDVAGNVTSQVESWPGDSARPAGTRLTNMGYDAAGHLSSEQISAPGEAIRLTQYHYDRAANRASKVIKLGGSVETRTFYSYNLANQLTSWTERDDAENVLRTASFTYDLRGNRSGQTITLADTTQTTTAYQWDFQNRLIGVTLPDASQHSYAYDYRTRRIGRDEDGTATAVSWSGGLSLAEYSVSSLQSTVSDPQSPEVEYRRGPDMGGGIGGLLHTLRDGVVKYNLSNGRGDIVAQSNQAGALTWTASYEAFGTRPVEYGSNADRQRANTKEEDPTGLLWEHFRYRDLETGVWLSRDPAGFVDGPNLYVNQNPWTSFGCCRDQGFRSYQSP